MKKIVSLLFVFTLLLSMATTAFAAEMGSGSVSMPIIREEDSIQAPRAPKDFKNLGGANSYTATLIDLAASMSSFTKYYFATGTGRIYLKCDLERSGTTTNKERQLTVNLYRKDKASSSGVFEKKTTINFSEAEITKRVLFTGLNCDKFYYIEFKNSSASNASSRRDISASILVDDNYN